MSESEQKGRCRSEVDMSGSGGPVTNAIADAIDRLAADVAAVKAKVDAVSPEDVAHFVESEKAWVALVTVQRDAAIRERDAANQRRADTVRRLVQAQAEVAQLRDSRDVANRLFGAEQAKVERLRKELEQRQPAGNSPETLDSSPAAPQPAGQGISPKVADTQPTRNAAPAAGWLTDEEREAIVSAGSELSAIGHHRPPDKELCRRLSAALQSVLNRHDKSKPARGAPPPAAPAAGWLTEEERRILSAHVQALRDQRRAMERGGQTLGYSANPCGLKREADAIDALLSRAGSPPPQTAAGWEEVPDAAAAGGAEQRDAGRNHSTAEIIFPQPPVSGVGKQGENGK